jgi:serine/threonine protein kinase
MNEVLDSERWSTLQVIYSAVVQLPLHERAAYLDQACAGDEELRGEADSLLAADDEAADDFLENGAFTLGMEILAADEVREGPMSSDTTLRFETNFAAQRVLDGRYQILGELDGGGMGEVFTARDLKFPDRMVVVKVMKKEAQRSAWKIKKFRAEGKAQSRVQHANVATVFDTGDLPSGEPYLVMEFVKGSTLWQRINEGKIEDVQMDFAEVVEIVQQISRGVSAIHKANLIHRDVKPKNIMVFEDEDTGELTVKVIDFGIVRDLDRSTVPGQSVGTLPYMSPEQINGDEVTQATDIYALGVISYQMLTNHLPFNAQTYTQIYAMQMEGVKVKPGDLRRGLPLAAEHVLLKALSYNPSHRQQSAREFSDDLKRSLTTEPKQQPTPQPSPSEATTRTLPKATRLNKWLVASAAALLVTIILGMLWFWKPFGKTLAATEVLETRINGQTENAATNKAPRIYDAEGWFPTGSPPSGMVYVGIGVDVFRLRPVDARDSDETAREIIDGQESVSERTEDYVTNGEKLFLNIESLTGSFLPDKGGYLYVVNREQYADGTYGKARLIFPTLLTYGGQNRVRPGQPIALPRSQGKPFSIKRSTPSQTAETFTIILSPWAFQLPEPLTDHAIVLPDSVFADWERRYRAKMYRATLRDGLGQTKTKREQAVSTREIIDGAEAPLTQDDPLPQTVFRGVVRNGNPAMVTVTLKFRD